MRLSGGKWIPLSGPLGGAGLMELSWRDPVANIQIEKRRLALVPRDANIVGTMKTAISGEISCTGCPDGPQLCATIPSQSMRPTFPVSQTGSPDNRLSAADDALAPQGRSLDVIVSLA